MQTIELPGKRIELLRAVLPDLLQLAVIANVGYPAALHEAAACRRGDRIRSADIQVWHF
jgi:hypothetical protein